MVTTPNGLDFETFGAVNLPKHGLDRYVNDKSFKPLIASVSTVQNSESTYDFVFYPSYAERAFEKELQNWFGWNAPIVAHNAGFERAVMNQMGLPIKWQRNVVDSAVVARAQGAASHLEAAAPQLTDLNKMEAGKELIQLFSIPNDRNGGKPFTRAQIEADSELFDKWQLFKAYCEIDARAGRMIYMTYRNRTETDREDRLELLTWQMNQAGWKVDLPLVREMQMRYEANLLQIEQDFAREFADVNLNSTQQLVQFAADRGVRTKSWDMDHVQTLRTRLEKKLNTMKPGEKNWQEYTEVLRAVKAKQELGGSSLKKLQTILDLVGEDGRLRNQYMHVGAGQSYRTTGKGVQMQNLKRLGDNMIDEMEDLYDEENEYSNEEMGENLRQVFVSSETDGFLIVGDFSSVESRGLAWWAGADWKTEAFRQGKDMYKVQASTIYGVPYDMVDKQQRQTGKIGELSCGYGAGKVSIKSFAHGYGVEMTEDEAEKLKTDWRATNPEIVNRWWEIDDAIHEAVALKKDVEVELSNNLLLVFEIGRTPKSLLDLHPGAVTIEMKLYFRHGMRNQLRRQLLVRVFQGCYSRGRNICFYKPSDRKTGALWKSHFQDPKTKQTRFYDVYGGKLAGILTQSMCREMFFDSVELLYGLLDGFDNVQIVGQFHDELVVDWIPKYHCPGGRTISFDMTKKLMEQAMSTTDDAFAGFPLVADIKHGYRYIK